MDSVIRFTGSSLFNCFPTPFQKSRYSVRAILPHSQKSLLSTKKEPFELEAFYTNLHEVPYPDPELVRKLPIFFFHQI